MLVYLLQLSLYSSVLPKWIPSNVRMFVLSFHWHPSYSAIPLQQCDAIAYCGNVVWLYNMCNFSIPHFGLKFHPPFWFLLHPQNYSIVPTILIAYTPWICQFPDAIISPFTPFFHQFSCRFLNIPEELGLYFNTVSPFLAIGTHFSLIFSRTPVTKQPYATTWWHETAIFQWNFILTLPTFEHLRTECR